MAMVKDEWIRSAMIDDSVPAELLIGLKQSYSSELVRMSPGIVLSPRWGHRQPRSRPVSRCDAVSPRKDGTATRCSPTTPLSWSSQSTTADGFEASSQLKNCFPLSRSKDILTITNEASLSINRKSTKRKTFAELKEKEIILLKERIHLDKELATLRATLMDQTAKNQFLKRLKVEYSLESIKKTTAFLQYKQASTSSQAPLVLSTQLPSDKIPQPNLFQVQKSEAPEKIRFVVPDLNTTPSENDSEFETLYCMS